MEIVKKLKLRIEIKNNVMCITMTVGFLLFSIYFSTYFCTVYSQIGPTSDEITTSPIVITTDNLNNPTNKPKDKPTETPQFYELGFLVGMGLMGGFILMLVLFMSITACQRAYKNKSPKKAITPQKENQNDVIITINKQ